MPDTPFKKLFSHLRLSQTMHPRLNPASFFGQSRNSSVGARHVGLPRFLPPFFRFCAQEKERGTSRFTRFYHGFIHFTLVFPRFSPPVLHPTGFSPKGAFPGFFPPVFKKAFCHLRFSPPGLSHGFCHLPGIYPLQTAVDPHDLSLATFSYYAISVLIY